jgi:hypothetical protein
MEQNWDFLDVSVRDAARDVLNRKLTFEEAAKQYNVPVNFIEAKVTDPNYHPPRQPRQTSTVVDALRRAGPVEGPRDVLNAEDKATKAAIKKDLELAEKEKRATHPIRVRCIEQAVREVVRTVDKITPRAAAEKYCISVEDVQGQLKNPYYATQLPVPLGPNQRAKQRVTPSAKQSSEKIVNLPRTSSDGRNFSEQEIPDLFGTVRSR